MRVTIEVEYSPPRDPAKFREWMRHAGDGIELIDHLDTGGFVIRVKVNAKSVGWGVQTALASLDAWFMGGPSPDRPMPVVAVRATKQAVNDRLAELVGIHEIAELLGVSRQRVAKLKQDERFPRPVANLAMGPVYARRAVLRFGKETGRSARPLARLQ